jgi:hypothetical protein
MYELLSVPLDWTSIQGQPGLVGWRYVQRYFSGIGTTGLVILS